MCTTGDGTWEWKHYFANGSVRIFCTTVSNKCDWKRIDMTFSCYCIKIDISNQNSGNLFASISTKLSIMKISSKSIYIFPMRNCNTYLQFFLQYWYIYNIGICLISTNTHYNRGAYNHTPNDVFAAEFVIYFESQGCHDNQLQRVELKICRIASKLSH